jgi:FkbM family methyltransferase
MTSGQAAPEEDHRVSTSIPIDDDRCVHINIDGRGYDIVLTDPQTDYIQRELEQTRLPYELAMLRDMQTHLEPGDLVIDVGANIGNHTLFLAAVVGCRVVAFEPNQRLLRGLRSSVEANGLTDRVQAHAYGIGATAGIGQFAASRPQNLGAQRITVGSGDIEIRSLDHFAFENVRALKIDVEEMELAVLTGATQLISAQRPLIYIECSFADAYDRVYDFLTRLDYECWATFNRTPTHLFCPSEHCDAVAKLARLLGRAGREIYQYRLQVQLLGRVQNLAALQQMLEAERSLVASLKDRVAVLESAAREPPTTHD